jgi:hypothetical protein
MHRTSIENEQVNSVSASEKWRQTRSEITPLPGTLTKPDAQPKEEHEQVLVSGSKTSNPAAGGVASLITSSVPTALEGPIDISQGSQPSMIAPSSTSFKVFYPAAPKLKDGQWFFQCPCCYQTLPSSAARGPRWRQVFIPSVPQCSSSRMLC